MSRQVIITVHFWDRNDLLTEQRSWELNCLTIHGELRVLNTIDPEAPFEDLSAAERDRQFRAISTFDVYNGLQM